MYETYIGDYTSRKDLNSLERWIAGLNKDLEDSGSLDRYAIHTEMFSSPSLTNIISAYLVKD